VPTAATHPVAQFGVVAERLAQARKEPIPFGPRLGRPLNVTGFGKGDRLDVGVTLNPTAFPDGELFRDCLEHAFAELTQAAR
jgi:hypothetical protein